MYKTIMVPTDCSGFDREAIRVALRIAERSEAKVRLVRVLTSGAYFGAGDSRSGVGASLNTIKHERDHALAELYALAAECRRAADIDITVALESGPPGRRPGGICQAKRCRSDRHQLSRSWWNITFDARQRHRLAHSPDNDPGVGRETGG